jgi:hypothetical protein
VLTHASNPRVRASLNLYASAVEFNFFVCTVQLDRPSHYKTEALLWLCEILLDKEQQLASAFANRSKSRALRNTDKAFPVRSITCEPLRANEDAYKTLFSLYN